MPNELSETKPESSTLTMATRRAPLPLCYFPRVRNGSSTGITLPSTSEFVDLTSPVRIGSPSPLLPLPLFSYPAEPLTRETYNWPVLKETCLVVLARYNVHPKDFDLAHRQPYSILEPLEMKHLTLFIEAQANHNTWLPALEGLRIHLATISHKELKVELIDPRIDEPKKVLLIKWDPAFRNAWNDNIRHLVNNEILHNIRVGKMVDVVDVGTGDEDDESPRTILITLFGEEADAEWLERIERIKSICAEAGYEDVEVQVGSGHRWLKG